jgi:hypothetical protein
MEGIIWLFLALLVALVALGAALAGLRRRALRIKLDHSPSCRTPMSLRRVVFFVWPSRSGTSRRPWLSSPVRTSVCGRSAGLTRH